MTTQTIRAAIVGVHFRPPAKSILAHLSARCPLRVRPEPTNPYDEFALQVLVASADIPQSEHDELGNDASFFGHSLESILEQPEWHLGYIPKVEAVHLQPRVICMLDDMQAQGDEGTDYLPAFLAFDAAGKPQVSFELPAEQGAPQA